MIRFAALIFFISPAFEIVAQSSISSAVRMPAITRIGTNFVQVRKTFSRATLTVPPHFIYKIEGYDYLVNLELYLPDSSGAIDTTLSIVCFLPDNSVRQFSIEPAKLLKTSNQFLEYSFPFEIKEEGWYGFILTTDYEIRRGIDPRFYQQVSNKQSIFLQTPTE